MEDSPEINHLYSCSRWAGDEDADEVIRQYLRDEARAYETLKRSVPSEEDIPYGEGEQQKVDVWGKVGKKLFIFMHGGFWQEGDRKYLMSPAIHSCPSVAYASVGYTFAKEERPLSQTVQDTVDAITMLLEKYSGVEEVILGGHSAGAHLAYFAAARLRNPKITKMVLLAGVYDNKELVTCEIGRGIGLTKEEAIKNECHVEQLKGLQLEILMMIGEKDSPRLIEQNHRMAEELGKEHKVTFKFLKCHHFDLITGLQDRGNVQTEALLEVLKLEE